MFSRFQYALPLFQVSKPVAEMIHRIDAHDCIKCTIIKRQALIDIRSLKCSACDICRACLAIGRLNPLLVNIKPCDPTLEFLGQVEGRSAGTARDFENMSSWRETEPAVERVILIRGDPTVLTDILPKGFLPHSRQYLFIKITVSAVV